MEEKLEMLRDYISSIEMIEEVDRDYLLNLIDDIERDIDIREEAYNFLSDEDNF